MQLIDVIYQSLLLFTGLFVGVLIISYISYRIKNKGKELKPHLAGDAKFDLGKPIFDEKKQFMKTSVYSQEGIRPKKNYKSKSVPNFQIPVSYNPSNPQPREIRSKRYTKVDTLTKTFSKRTYERKFASTKSEEKEKIFAGDFSSNGRYSLASANVLYYYSNEKSSEFYKFNTKT
ncbi:MAG: hypothetical protein D6830_03615 [Ignavibacteria bacterium]|nr:MAG: hypothetical protein D6830_03615 [Ignavibacteria bacterium]